MKLTKLYKLLKASEEKCRRIVTNELKENGYTPTAAKDFIYAEGSVPVLLVAHYDTVPDTPTYVKNNKGILSAKHGLGADDRAGIYAILETIKEHKCHVLFTGGEEIGGVGARAFTKSGIKPEVNYIIQLDRRGTNDAVYYEGDNKEFEQFITDNGWETAIGTFTDICIIAPYLGASAVNLSIGYKNEHCDNETLNTKAMFNIIRRIPKLLYNPRKFEWIEKPYTSWYGGCSDWYDYEDYYDPYIITYEDELGFVKEDLFYGIDDVHAVGEFLMEHPSLTYRHIGDIRFAEGKDEDLLWTRKSSSYLVA